MEVKMDMQASRTQGVSVFRARDRAFVPYADAVERAGHGSAQIAHLVNKSTSRSMGVGVAVYEAMTVEWTLPFDETITVIEGSMHVRSDGLTHFLEAGDVAWFPAETPLTYIVEKRVVVSYAIYPMP
jgi:ethanolamine utilization protein EutQ